jgi:hypothetical protein
VGRTLPLRTLERLAETRDRFIGEGIVTGRLAVFATVLLVAACASGASIATPTTQPSATVTQGATPTLPSVSPTALATASAISSATSAACMDAATLDLLLHPPGQNFQSLTDAQIAAIVAALRAYDFGSDATAVQWRDQIVADFEAHRLSDATLAMGTVVMGAVRLVACP